MLYLLIWLVEKAKASISEAELHRFLNGRLILMQGSMQESLHSTAASKSEKSHLHPPPLELLFFRLRTVDSQMWQSQGPIGLTDGSDRSVQF